MIINHDRSFLQKLTNRTIWAAIFLSAIAVSASATEPNSPAAAATNELSQYFEAYKHRNGRAQAVFYNNASRALMLADRISLLSHAQTAVTASPRVRNLVSDSETQHLYGAGQCLMDGLSNTDVGNAKKSAQRFRATTSGRVASLKTYWIAGPGYSHGNGGTVRIRILPDDNSSRHLPDLSAVPLATGSFVPDLQDGRFKSYRHFETIELTAEQPLIVDVLYHVVYDNVDPYSSVNYVGLNHTYTLVQNGPPCRWASPLDWAVLEYINGVWIDSTVGTHDNRNQARFIPILQLTFEDGTVFGHSLIEAGNIAGRLYTINNNTPARERFQPTQARTITGLSVNTASSVAGSMLYEIRQDSRVLASGMISESLPSFRLSGPMGFPGTGVLKWFDITLKSPVQFQAGQTYDVVLTPQGDSQWQFAVTRNGADYGFLWPASFTESQAQHSSHGIWIDACDHSQMISCGGSNWRLVLRSQ